MSKIEQNKEKKRRAILQAAQTVFLSEGYVQAGMDRIAAEAEVTKQTVYRYFPSKTELLKATLQQMGERPGMDFGEHLEIADTREALYQFAKGFIQAHLSDEHLATVRLLIAESTKAPELTSSFWSIGPNETNTKLNAFFSHRLGLENAASTAEMWLAMLLSHRTSVLMGMDKPTGQEINDYADEATAFLLAAVA